eukprot:Seg530.3 transcript_id=Seg530.3/GoldUCD/mRNA.D3Y31 product="hypothetical protein" protein_id=Seg530.3/GoldUCD/D3Y31
MYLLATVDNVLDEEQCLEIISNSHVQDNQPLLSGCHKLFDKAPSQRLIEDKIFADRLWKVIKPALNYIIKGNEYEIRPLGFDVLRGEWKLDGLNESFTIETKSVVEHMSKSASINTTEKAEFLKDITPQRDTQFCRSNNERSLLSIHIFLNDDLDGGNIEFHFPKVGKEKLGCFRKGMTIQQETECAGGLENGYKTIHIEPKVGKAVIYSPHLLYSLQPPIKGSTVYKLKTDVVVKRENENCIFVLSDIERDDYIKCMDYFRQAQSLEVDGKRKDAGELLEKALSIRYSYPTRVTGQSQMNNMNIERQGNEKNVLPDFVWEQIFDSLSGRDIGNLVKVFPDLRDIQTARELHRFRRDEDLSENIPPYIPTFKNHSGIVTEFKFRDVSFFNENTAACIRVAAMYALYLLGRTNMDKFYTVRFNPDTHQVSGLALKSLLTEVFHNRPLHGAVYGINQLDGNKKNFDTDFNASVDRAYMAMRHNAQFIGVPLSEKMKVKIRWPQITEEEITEIYEDLERGAESGAHVQDHLEHNDEVPLDCKPFITRSIKNSLIRHENASEERVDEFLLFYANRLCRIGGFPVILKDLMRYRKWHDIFFHIGLRDEIEWPNNCLMGRNEVVYCGNALSCSKLPLRQ